jgi:TetR/AcrR family transcriptional regulator, regulator of autoinduction and epiphytic fitness
MKVSKEKQEEIRRALIDAAVELVVEKGFSRTTTREIASRAGVAPGTAYKYFPRREQLLLAFFEAKFVDAEAATKALPGFDSYGLKEKIQAFVESLLSEYLEEREFVALALRTLIDAPLQSIGAMQPLKERFTRLVDGFLDDAAAQRELDPITHQAFYSSLFWDYSILVTLYWVGDKSEGFSRTTEFVDRSLDLYVTLLKSGVVDKAARLLGFFVKNHLYGNLEQIAAVVTGIGQLRRELFTVKP